MDTTYVEPITNLVMNPDVTAWIIGSLIALGVYIASVVFAWLKIPKNIAVKLIEYATLICGAIIKAQGKIYPANMVIPAKQQAKLMDAVTTLERDILDSPNKSFFGKVTKVLGGVVPVINFVVPIIKPFIKGKK